MARPSRSCRTTKGSYFWTSTKTGERSAAAFATAWLKASLTEAAPVDSDTVMSGFSGSAAVFSVAAAHVTWMLIGV